MAVETNTWFFWKQNKKNHNNNINDENHNDTNLNRLSGEILQTLKLRYKANDTINLTKSTKASPRKSLLEKHDFRIILTGTKLGLQFNIKDDTNKKHKHDLFSRCPSTECYIGETPRHLIERIMDYGWW